MVMQSTEELIERIRRHASKLIFQEAMRAYAAGAHQAATIILWTAVMHDLADKIRILAEDGDAAAQVEIQKLDGARAANNIRALQAFENELLSLATNKFELLTSREAQELSRLNEDRNICAHPTFLEYAEDFHAISGEQSRAHARLVVDAVLSQPPIVGKALTEMYISDIDGDSWPEESLTEFLRERYFIRARDSVKRNIVILTIKQAIAPENENNQRAGRCVAAIRAAFEIDETLVNSALGAVMRKKSDGISEKEILRAVGAVGTFEATWKGLGAANVTRAKELLNRCPVDQLLDERAFASGPPVELQLAEPYAKAAAKLSDEQVEAMTRKPYPRAQWVPRVVAAVTTAQSYRGAEHAMRMVVNVASELQSTELGAIAAEFGSNSQFYEASAMPQLINNAIRETINIAGAQDIWKNALDAAEKKISDQGNSQYYDFAKARLALGL